MTLAGPTGEEEQQKGDGPRNTDISERDLANVRKLRELVKDELSAYYDTDFNLLRWLQGYGNNVEELVPKLRNHLLTRRTQFQFDSLADGPRNHPVHSIWSAGLTGQTGPPLDCLVWVERTGTIDFWAMLNRFSLNEVFRANMYDMELMLRRVMEKERETGRQHGIMFIMDLSGLKFDRNLIKMTRDGMGSAASVMTEHYVELIHSFVLVNAPNFISMLWQIAKPLLPERSRNKVHILRASNWRREILKMAPPEVLPSFWNEPGKEKIFQYDFKFPEAPAEEIACIPLPSAPPLANNFTLLSIPHGKTAVVEVHGEKNETLEWTFHADAHFSFGLYFVAKGEEGADEDEGQPAGMDRWTMVYPRLNLLMGPTFVPIRDSVLCERTGLYKLWLSNEHAWLHTLKIRYRIDKCIN